MILISSLYIHKLQHSAWHQREKKRLILSTPTTTLPAAPCLPTHLLLLPNSLLMDGKGSVERKSALLLVISLWKGSRLIMELLLWKPPLLKMLLPRWTTVRCFVLSFIYYFLFLFWCPVTSCQTCNNNHIQQHLYSFFSKQQVNVLDISKTQSTTTTPYP